MRKPNKEIQLTSYDDLLGMNEDQSEVLDRVIEVPLTKLYAFKDHPFFVKDDAKMEETVESIRNHGVLNPGLVRPRPQGGYEIISGHRRKRGSELAGKEEMPVIVRNYTDDEAVIIMVDSNIQRENILPSEKAFAYKMKYAALKHQGSKGEINTADMVGEKTGESGRTVQRYIRLTELLPELLEMVDTGKIKLIPAESISYLKKNEQEWVVQCLEKKSVTVSGGIAQKLKQYSADGKLTELEVELVLLGVKKTPEKVVLPKEKIKQYFPENYSKQQIEEVIFALLEEWKNR